MTTNLTALYGISASSGGCRWKSQTFTTSGVWRKPTGVDVVKVLLVGAGGSGGRFNNDPLGNNGGNSQFGDVIARGGSGAGRNGDPRRGGLGGGVGSGVLFDSNPVNSPYSPQGISNLANAHMGVTSLFGSSGAGGGLPPLPNFATSFLANGGNVIGLGNGGIGNTSNSRPSGGGGASYGNGGNGASDFEDAKDGVLGGGGGGGPNGLGGGGGEIVLREIPVFSDVVVVIGAGGNKVYASSTLIGGAGGNGLCIVYWLE